MPDPDAVSNATRDTEEEDEHIGSAVDRAPTPEEEEAAERAPEASGDVAENYEEQMETGAAVEGEGKIS